MTENKKIFVIPCSGIGKAVGAVSRKAAYHVVDTARPEQARTTCLALLTVGDEETQRQVRETVSIAIDGCPSQCATKNITASNGRVIKSFVLTEELRNNRELKPTGTVHLNADGVKFAQAIADKVIATIDATTKPQEAK